MLSILSSDVEIRQQVVVRIYKVKIGIYNEPRGGGIGGSECMMAVLAEALSQSHKVDFVHHRKNFCLERLAEQSGTNLSHVHPRYVAPEPFPAISAARPWRRYQAVRKWHATLSEPYDLFIASVHEIPPFCHAPKGVLVVLFPIYAFPYILLQHDEARGDGYTLRERLAGGYHRREWAERLNTYEVTTAISQFSKVWTKRLWGAESQVVYPPVDTRFEVANKFNLILSVGRFAIEGEGHTKKQAEMLTAFSTLRHSGFSNWNYFCAGGLGNSPRHYAYFDELSRIGAECEANVIANVARNELKQLYEKSKIFWHAAGYGEDEDVHPELTEHFGISTVEAMAAGCVPIVINRGGQREIVQHGVSGFLWDTLDELKEYTLTVARDEQLRERMSLAARRRAQDFSREKFVESFFELLQPFYNNL